MATKKQIDTSELTQSILTGQAAATDRHAALTASTPCFELLQEILRLRKAEPERMDVEARLRNKNIGKPSKAQRVVECNNLIKELSETCAHPLNVLNGRLSYYNGKFWQAIPESEENYLFSLLGDALGVDAYEAKYCDFIVKLRDSFKDTNRVCVPLRPDGSKLLNCQNGTIEITQDGAKRREHRPEDGLQYVLPYNYEPNATCERFKAFLAEVLPEPPDRQNLQEYIGSCFSNINHEKIAYLYGATGRNGKTTFKDIICKMFGEVNVSNASLSTLTEKNGTGEASRAALEGKLLNACGEIEHKIGNSAQLKQLASREALSVRTPYAKATREIAAGSYARLLFCCNDLPIFTQGAAAEAEARRFLFIEFAKEIADDKIDRNLSKKIAANELPGVLNWAIEGLQRLSRQNGEFTENEHAELVKEQFLEQTNSVAAWLSDCGFLPVTVKNRKKYPSAKIEYLTITDLYGTRTGCDRPDTYCTYCSENGRNTQSRTSFTNTLRQLKFEYCRRDKGTRCYALLKLSDEERELRDDPEKPLL